MEGPFYVPGKPFRSDIREGREGIPLQLELIVQDYHSNCNPVPNAEVQVWQPDAMGVYSAYLGYYPLGEPGSKQITGDHAEPTDESAFLRGIQNTDAQGTATFKTVYPGWYLGRTMHIHFKVFTKGEEIYTGEVYFPEDISQQVSKVKPYSELKGRRSMNEEDWLFSKLDGSKSVANLSGDVKHGFTAKLIVVVELPMTEDEL
jgi:protocatechuate 3,4-dioxygenase beta subunit